MSQEPDKNNRIRRVPQSEKKGRQWPDKSQQASSYPGMFTPDLTKKDPFHSLVTALPVLMLLIGLAVWYVKDSAQHRGAPIAAESKQLTGEFNGVSKAQSASGAQYFMWLVQDGNKKTLRITRDQYQQHENREVGEAVTVTAAPTVSGSSILWVTGMDTK